MDENIREVITLVLSKIGKSRFEIAEFLAEHENCEGQITLYDANDDSVCEQLKF